MLTLFGKPFWHSPAKLIGFSLDGGDTSRQVFDAYSLSHVSFGVLFYFMFRAFHVKLLSGLYITIFLCILFEILENTPYFIKQYKKTYSAYEGDSIVNSLGDVSCSILGYFTAYKFPLLAIAYVIFMEIILFPFKVSILQLSLCRVIPFCGD